MPDDVIDLVTVHILVYLQYPDGTQIGPFTQVFDVPTDADIADVEALASDAADNFLENYPLYGLAGEGEPFAFWELVSPLYFQYQRD